MSEKQIEINGGKMYVGGVEFQRLDGPENCSTISGTVDGVECFVSAGMVYLGNGSDCHCVGSVPYEDFKAWRDGQK